MGGRRGSEGAGEGTCVWEGGGVGGRRVSLNWVMAESSRWCSLKQKGVAQVLTKSECKVMSSKCIKIKLH